MDDAYISAREFEKHLTWPKGSRDKVENFHEWSPNDFNLNRNFESCDFITVHSVHSSSLRIAVHLLSLS